jgi:hypothetical protein
MDATAHAIITAGNQPNALPSPARIALRTLARMLGVIVVGFQS